jgi:hypothetical protein
VITAIGEMLGIESHLLLGLMSFAIGISGRPEERNISLRASLKRQVRRL